MADNKNLDRVRYNMTDNQGNPVNVPGWLLQDWIKADDERKAKADRGESTEPDPKVMEQMLEDMEKYLEDL